MKLFEHFHIQALNQKGKLIPEQYASGLNPLIQLAIHPLIPLATAIRTSPRLPDAHPAALHLTPDNQRPMYVRFHFHLSNILNTHTTTSNASTLKPLTFHTIDTLYPFLSLGTQTKLSPQYSENT